MLKLVIAHLVFLTPLAWAQEEATVCGKIVKIKNNEIEIQIAKRAHGQPSTITVRAPSSKKEVLDAAMSRINSSCNGANTQSFCISYINQAGIYMALGYEIVENSVNGSGPNPPSTQR